MSNLAIFYAIEAVRSLAYTGISGTYAKVGTPSSNPSRQILITNNTNAAIMVSLDGVTDNFPLLAGAAFIDDICSNKTEQGGSLQLKQGTQFWVKQLVGAPSSGSVYVTYFYGANANTN